LQPGFKGFEIMASANFTTFHRDITLAAQQLREGLVADTLILLITRRRIYPV
jgi:hypothetical protein